MPSIVLAHILIWFLALGQGSEVYLTLTTGCLGVALQPSAAHTFLTKLKTFSSSLHTYLIPHSFLSSFVCPHQQPQANSYFRRTKNKLNVHQLILTWRGSKAWSRRGFFQCEALALHFAWADLCDCYKCSNSTVQFLVVGACVRARPLLYTWLNWKRKEHQPRRNFLAAHGTYLSYHIRILYSRPPSAIMSPICFFTLDKRQKPTTPGVPRRSPIQVLSWPDDA